MYACTLHIARKRVEERLAIENVCVRLKNGASWGCLGHLPVLPGAFRKGAIR